MKDLVESGVAINVIDGSMTSFEISEITGKEHKNILRDIRVLLEQGVQALNFEPLFRIRDLPNGGKKEEPYFRLSKKGCLLLASGYDALLREKIINRWEELEIEKRKTLNIPRTFSEALQLAANQARELEEKNALLLEQQPKVDFFDAVADSKDAISIGDLSKILGIKGFGRNNLFEFLRRKKVLMDNNVPYQRYQDMGLFRVIEQKFMKNGEPCINIKTLVYQKGVDYVRNLIEKKR